MVFNLLTIVPGGFQTYYCDGFKASPKGSVSNIDLIGTDGKETKKGEIDAAKLARLTTDYVASAGVAGTAAREWFCRYKLP